MKPVIDSVWIPMQTELFDKQKDIESEAESLLKQNKRTEAVNFLTKYSNDCANKAVKTAWETGDYIWTAFDGLW